jgi:hypothetical protein
MSLVVAIGARAMNWFAIGFRFFQLVSERASSEIFQFIALKVASLCF